MLLHVFLHALLDTLTLVPFLLGTYLLMEYIEHRAEHRWQFALSKVGRAGPALGALLGLLPQCGFSATAANLFAGGLISHGTLLAVFLSTSDEALPVLIGVPEGRSLIWKLLLIKLAMALIIGFIFDTLIKHRNQERQLRDLCEKCGCGPGKGILKPALWHTAHISLFILIVNFILSIALEYLGQDGLQQILLSGSILQPLIAALVGLIPNCAASVMLTQLYLTGALSFGSLIAGLCSGAGIGLAVLVRMNGSRRETFQIIGTLFGVSAVIGLLIQVIF